MNLGTLLDMVAINAADRIVLGSLDNGTTGVELRATALAGAHALRAAGTRIVIFAGEGGGPFTTALLASALAGIPFLPLNYRLSPPQLAELVARYDGAWVIADDPALIGEPPPTCRAVHSSSSWREVCDRPAGEPTWAEPAADDVAVVLMTSGTTAAPKSAVLRHRHLTSYVLGSVEFGSAAPDEAVIVSVPPYHIAAVANLLSNLYRGRRIVYLPRFDAAAWLAAASRERATHAMLVPTMLARIVTELEEETGPHPAALRSLSYGGARIPASVLERALRALPDVDFVNAYGLTETSSTVAVLTPEDHRRALAAANPEVRDRIGSVGRPLPQVQIVIRRPDGSACATGESGHIFVRGEQVAGEYRETGRLTDADGWFATRDEGYLDRDGYLFVNGRTDDTIIRGGENIAPAEIESVLQACPGVADVAVIGIPDDHWGERVGAAIVPQPGTQLTQERVRAHARAHLRSSKTPDEVWFVESLPYTPTGKLVRRQVLPMIRP